MKQIRCVCHKPLEFTVESTKDYFAFCVNGEPIPLQRGLDISYSANDHATLTVEFYLDGKTIKVGNYRDDK